MEDTNIVDVVDAEGRAPGFYACAEFNGQRASSAGPFDTKEAADTFIVDYRRESAPIASLIMGHEVKVEDSEADGTVRLWVEEVPA